MWSLLFFDDVQAPFVDSLVHFVKWVRRAKYKHVHLSTFPAFNETRMIMITRIRHYCSVITDAGIFFTKGLGTALKPGCNPPCPVPGTLPLHFYPFVSTLP